MSSTGSGRGSGRGSGSTTSISTSINSYGGYGGRAISGGNFAPVGRPGFYGFEQQTINGSRFTWIPTRQRWELSGGTLYNEQLDKNPEQVRQEVLRDGGTPEEAEAARNRQVRDLTNPSSNYQYGTPVETGAGTEIVDNQSEISALEQIVQKESQAGDEGREEAQRALESLQNNAAYQANQGSGRGSGTGTTSTQTTTPSSGRGSGRGSGGGRGSGRGRTRITTTRGKTTTNGSKKSTTTYPSIGVSDLFKKIDTNLPRVTIRNTYPQLEDRNITESQFLSGVRESYKKGVIRGRGARGSGSGNGSGTGVNHTAISPNGVSHINTYNRLGSLFSEDVKLPRPFGLLGKNWTNYKPVNKNLEGRDTTIRFFVEFVDSGNVYVSKQLQLDLDYAQRNGNPYFTEHLIPTVKLDKRKLNILWQSFRVEEERWKNFSIGIGLSAEVQDYSLDYLPIDDSLGTESGTEGEIEIFKYIDSLLKSPPTGETPEFIEPYRKGTVIETSWYSSNPRGFGMTESQEEVTELTDGGASSGVGSGTSSGVGAGSTTSSGRGSGIFGNKGSGRGGGTRSSGTGSGNRRTTTTTNRDTPFGEDFNDILDYMDRDDRDRY